MTEPETRRRNPVHVAIAALSIALVAVAALVAFLIWGRPAPTVQPIPSPTPSSSPTMQTASQSPTTTQSPTTATPATSAPVTTAPATPSDTSPTATATTPVTDSPAASPGSSTASSSAAASPAAAQTMMWQGRATFEHFTAEVLQDNADQDVPMIEGKAGLLVEVCATKALEGTGTVRISSDPWTLQDSDGGVQQAQEGGYEPAFPTDAEYAVGTCARGYLTFDYLSVESDYANLVYENGLGDRAVWQFH